MKLAVRSKGMNKRCKPTNKRVAQYLFRDPWLFWTIVHLRIIVPSFSPSFFPWLLPPPVSRGLILHCCCVLVLGIQRITLKSGHIVSMSNGNLPLADALLRSVQVLSFYFLNFGNNKNLHIKKEVFFVH